MQDSFFLVFFEFVGEHVVLHSWAFFEILNRLDDILNQLGNDTKISLQFNRFFSLHRRIYSLWCGHPKSSIVASIVYA